MLDRGSGWPQKLKPSGQWRGDACIAPRMPQAPWPETSLASRLEALACHLDCRSRPCGILALLFPAVLRLPSGIEIVALRLLPIQGLSAYRYFPRSMAGVGVRWDPSPPNALARHRQ